MTSVPVDSKTLRATDLVFRALISDNNNDEWARWAAKLFRTLDERTRALSSPMVRGESSFLSIKFEDSAKRNGLSGYSVFV